MKIADLIPLRRKDDIVDRLCRSSRAAKERSDGFLPAKSRFKERRALIAKQVSTPALVDIGQQSFTEWMRKKKEHKRKAGAFCRSVIASKVTPDIEAPALRISFEKISSTAFRHEHGIFQYSGSSFNRKKNVKKAIDLLPDGLPGDVGFNGESLVDPSRCLREVGKGTQKRAGRVDGSPNVVRMLSRRSKQKIREKFYAFFEKYKSSSTFLTLTFIQRIGDKEAVSLLNNFFVQLRKDFEPKKPTDVQKIQYIWVAERQEENGGNIHFHIILNKRLDILRYNSLWVLQQYHAGLRGWSHIEHRYIEMHEVQARHDKTMRLLDQLKEKNADHRAIRSEIEMYKVGKLFNPFQIRKVTTTDGLGLYLTKYVTKNNSQFECSTWHCTRIVSRFVTAKAAPRRALREAASNKNSYVNRQTGELHEHKIITNNYNDPTQPVFCTVVYFLNKKYFRRYVDELKLVNDWIAKGNILDFRRWDYDEYLRYGYNN